MGGLDREKDHLGAIGYRFYLVDEVEMLEVFVSDVGVLTVGGILAHEHFMRLKALDIDVELGFHLA